MNLYRYLLTSSAALALLIASPLFADGTPPGDSVEKPALADFPTLLGAITKSAKPSWRDFYRKPVAPRGDRNLGAIALGGVLADIYLAAEAYDPRQVKNLCIEIESHSRVLGIDDGSAGEARRLSVAAGNEDWDATQKSLADLRAKLHALLFDQRDPDLAGMVEIGFWLRGLEIASHAILSEPEATDLPLCIGSADRLNHIANRIDNLAEPMRKLPFVIDIRDEIGRLIRRWDGVGTKASQEDVEASYVKIRNLLRRIFGK